MITLNEKNLLKAELIGLNAEITDSKNRSNIGIRGKITDETKNTLKIGAKTILKKDAKITFEVNNQKITIEGKNIMKSPEERLKIR